MTAKAIHPPEDVSTAPKKDRSPVMMPTAYRCTGHQERSNHTAHNHAVMNPAPSPRPLCLPACLPRSIAYFDLGGASSLEYKNAAQNIRKPTMTLRAEA